VGLDVSCCADLADVERRLALEAATLREAHPDRGLVLSVRLRGRSSLHRDLARDGSVGELLSALRDRCPDHEPFSWWAALVSDVRREIDREALRERDDFCSELLELAEALADRPGELAVFAREHFAELPAELCGVAIPAPEDDELHSLFARAQETAFDLVDLPELAAGAATSEPGR
jgi:hypothetical protein